MAQLQLILLVGITSLLAALIGALIALKLQRNYVKRTRVHLQGWENAQESHQRTWEMQQEKNAAELKKEFTRQLEQVQQDWEEWKVRDRKRIETLARQYEESEIQLHVKRELARLPLVEDAPLILDARHLHRHSFPGWQPPTLQGANLSDYDFSHRFLGQADLRNAQLKRANFYMADLSGACMAGANLSGAYLAGANLSGADLRDATLTGANLLVTDLQGAVLIGANLLGVHNLTAQQLDTTIYDATTQLDVEEEGTDPRLHSIQPVVPSPSSTPEVAEQPPFVPTENPTPVDNASFAASQEVELPTVTPVMESPIIMQAEPELSSPPPSSDLPLGPEVADLQLNTHTDGFDTTTPMPEYNGTGRAKAS